MLESGLVVTPDIPAGNEKGTLLEDWFVGLSDFKTYNLETPSLYRDHFTTASKLYEAVELYHPPIKTSSPELVRLQVAAVVEDTTSGYAGYQEILTKPVFGAFATIAREYAEHAGVEYREDESLKDTLAVLRLSSVSILLGASRRFGERKRALSFVMVEDREPLQRMVVALSKETGSIEKATDRLAELSSKSVAFSLRTFRTMAGYIESIAGESRGDSGGRDEEELQKAIQEFDEYRKEVMAPIDAIFITPTKRFGYSLPDSQVVQLIETEPDIDVLNPRPSKKENVADKLAEIARFTGEVSRVLNEYIVACQKDAPKIGRLLSRGTEETEEDYALKVAELARLKMHSEQEAITEFWNSQERIEPEELLREVGDIIGARLERAVVSPHSYTVSDAVSEFGQELGGENIVARVTDLSKDLLSRFRNKVLVRKDSSDLVEEYRFTEGNLLDNYLLGDGERLVDYGPVNILTEEQYRKFVRVMGTINALS